MRQRPHARTLVAAVALAAAMLLRPAGASAGAGAQPLPVVTPRPGLVITRSVRIAPGTYRLPGHASLDSALLTVRGSDITVDLRGVTFIGVPPDSAPDAARGTAVRIDGGRNVRIRALTAHGYRVGILARNVRGLTLEGNDVSHSWKPRLFSLVEHESLADWLSYHRNEEDEWLRFGAGIYLRGVTGGRITGNTVRQSMNGLLLSHSDSLDIRGNDFSYNSGLGIGLYRASWHTIVENRADYAVRGSSHGFFQRGQDSAALLMFEQSQHNVVAYNSMTHGGDGLFLWAGQQTMDTGQGGSNDNLFLMNDFSYAPTNGMEATFSRNAFVGNRVVGSTHGLWGGYSYGSRVVGNCFGGNRIGIAVEHGQDNLIGGNHFMGDAVGVRLWADSIEPSDWGYPKHRDTRSRDWRIVENTFTQVAEPWRIANTSVLDTSRNVVRDTSTGECDPARIVPTTAWWRLPVIRNAPVRWPEAPNTRRDRRAIVIDEWGPYDWRSPKLWPVDSTRAFPLRLQVIGPAGRWRVVAQRGLAQLSARAGRMGDTLTVTPHVDSTGDWRVTLEYRGGPTVSPRGVRTAAGVPVRFVYEHFEPRQRWTQRIHVFTDSTHPFTAPGAFDRLLRGEPRLTRDAPRLDWMWSRPRDTSIPASSFAMEATTELTLPPGAYTVRTLSDDAVRVWIDEVLAIDHWRPHETSPAYATVRGGTHRLRVQYVQLGGWVELRLDILRGVVRRSEGSAGPH
ncbi:MAG: NosD domain-containing protein [Gemmatimonas sp.]|jgi:parallel beta-helix repeat protein|uniref:NosD domain-containing protein n=1 Tax=Gemmatimonas sp. TaxID=1962908 RepID=UPI00391EF477|nr:right-handed parallel beta-helix repeat-containing protein [Gemmatimonadota bacterium]